MNAEQQFNTRIAEIHGLAGETVMDVRHEEFKAMADAFLGTDFNEEKLNQIESLQLELHRQQAILFKKYEASELDPSDYVDACNSLLDGIAAMCEQILGQKDFKKLFGASPAELAGHIDKETFLISHNRKRGFLRRF